MVSLTEHHASIVAAKNDPELSGFQHFLEGATNVQWSRTVPHVGLIESACGTNEKAFRRELAQLEGRHVSASSDWARNHTLIFFLLLGCSKWKINSPIFEDLWALQLNGNRYETEMRLTLRSIHRKQRGYDSEYGFVKLGHDLLVGPTELLDDDLVGVFKRLDSIEVIELEEGFFGLLANWVFRQIVARRAPTNEVSLERAMVCISKNKSTISALTAFRLMMGLPISVALWLGGILVSSFFAGYQANKLINPPDPPYKEKVENTVAPVPSNPAELKNEKSMKPHSEEKALPP